MPNHIHLICIPRHFLRGQIQDNFESAKVQQSFLKYTAQQVKFELLKTATEAVEPFKVKASDRQYQFWERNPLSIELWSRNVFIQKLQYIHTNPIQPHCKLCTLPDVYKY